jgi:hypothetical protein
MAGYDDGYDDVTGGTSYDYHNGVYYLTDNTVTYGGVYTYETTAGNTYETIWQDTGTSSIICPYPYQIFTYPDYQTVPAQIEPVEGQAPSVWVTNEFEWQARVLSDDERAAQRRLQEQRQAEAKVAEERRKVAETKGEELLKSIIGEAEFAAFKRRGFIDVPSMKELGKIYRIRPERRIGIVKDGREQHLSLCIHPSEWGYVVGDLIATHVLLCKYDEARLEQVANLHQMAA